MLSARYGRNRDGYFWERYGGAGVVLRKVRWIVNFRGVGSCSSCRDGLGVEGGTPGIQEATGSTLRICIYRGERREGGWVG